MCEKDSALSPRAPLSREAVKSAAMLTMLANHVAGIFMESGTFWAEVLTDIGYFTAPVMCWFLVEGYGRTRSKKRYVLRLAAFAALSELPFCLAFSRDGLEFVGMNMLYTLLVCFGILLAGERLRPGLPRRLAQTALTLLTVLPPSDWGLLAPAYTLLFDWAKGSRRRTICTASSSTVRFRRPRKSIFRRPSSSRVVMVNWVVTEPSDPRERGTKFSAASGQITTPAACMEVWRGSPSSLRLMSMSSCTCTFSS